MSIRIGGRNFDSADRQAIGVAFFIAPHDPIGGVCATINEGARTFSNVNELDPSVLWVSNLVDSMLRLLPKKEWAHVTHDLFLPTPLEQILGELGYPAVIKEEELGQAAADAAEVYNRVSMLTQKHYGVALDTNGSSKLVAHFSSVLNEPEYISCAGEVLQNSWQRHYLANQDTRRNHVVYTLRFPRHAYIEQLLQVKLPVGPWHKLRARYPKGYQSAGESSAAYSFLTALANNQPAIAKIVAKNPPSEYASLLDPVSTNHSREWFPAHEAAQLAFYSDIAIRDIMVGSGYHDSATLVGFALPEEPAGAASISYSLLCEAHLAALTNQKNVGPWGPVHSPVSVWLSSWDRLFCQGAAFSLRDAGYDIHEYGQGSIVVKTTPHNRDQLILDAASLGMYVIGGRGPS